LGPVNEKCEITRAVYNEAEKKRAWDIDCPGLS